MIISDEEYEVLSKIAFGQCVQDCEQCKYYYPESLYECFAVDALRFILFNTREDKNEKR